MEKSRSSDAKDNRFQASLPIEKVGNYTWQEFLEKVQGFHNYAAPGVLVGGVMVSLAKERIPDGVLFEAISETQSCLPDSVQLLTPCTIGNGWLRIANLGRYALSLYDKYTGSGVRAYLDPRKLEPWQEIRNWLLKLKTKKEQDASLLQEQIRLAGTTIYSLQNIQVKAQYLSKHSKGKIGICELCGEAYPIKDGKRCLACIGETPYEKTTPVI